MQVMPVAVPLPMETNNAQKTSDKGGFGEVLNNAIAKLNQTESKADEVMQQFMVGEVQDIHQVSIAMQEAKLTMQLAVEVRNKIVEAYQEVSRIQL